METQTETIKRFESVGSEFEFVKFKDLSKEERDNHKNEMNNENDLVIIQKSFNPGFHILPLKNSDFIGFIVNKLIEENSQKREILRHPFSSF